ALRLLERLSRRRRKTPRRCSSASGVAEAFALSREPRLSISCQLVAIVVAVLAAGGYPGSDPELLHGLAEVAGDAFDIGHRGAVGEDAEAGFAVVGDDRDCQRVTAGEEADRKDPRDLASQYVEGDLRSGEVRDEQVEEAGREVDRRRRAQQHRGGEVAEPV